MDFEKELAEIVADLPVDPPDETVEILHKRGCLQDHALVYRTATVYDPIQFRKRKMVEATCTACGEHHYFEYAPIQSCSYVSDPFGFIDPWENEEKRTGSPCRCPNCGVVATAAHIGAFRVYGEYYRINHECSLTVHNVRGHLCILKWLVEKLCDKNGEVFYCPKKWDGALVFAGKVIRLAGHMKNLGGSLVFFPKWKSRKKWRDEIGTISFEEIIPFDSGVVTKSNCANSAFEAFCYGVMSSKISFQPAEYLRLWVKHPNVENLIRSDLHLFVASVIEKSTIQAGSCHNPLESFDIRATKAYVDWKKTKPHEMLRLEKCELHRAKEMDVDSLALFAFCKSAYKVNLDPEMILTAKTFGANAIMEILQKPTGGKRIPPVRLINYLQNVVMKEKENISFLRDYWNMAEKVYGDLNDSVLWPKSLRKAHDRAMLLVKEKENKELTEKIGLRAKKLDALCYEDPETGLFIRPARTQAELIKEGKILNHCVATYAKSVANGTTSIFFIRKTDEPDIPFFTLEFKNGKVNQNRGRNNCDRTKEVSAFEERWLAYLNKPKGRKTNGKQYAAQFATA